MGILSGVAILVSSLMTFVTGLDREAGEPI
jgi:hypothetical protein